MKDGTGQSGPEYLAPARWKLCEGREIESRYEGRDPVQIGDPRLDGGPRCKVQLKSRPGRGKHEESGVALLNWRQPEGSKLLGWDGPLAGGRWQMADGGWGWWMLRAEGMPGDGAISSQIVAGLINIRGLRIGPVSKLIARKLGSRGRLRWRREILVVATVNKQLAHAADLARARIRGALSFWIRGSSFCTRRMQVRH